MFPVLPRERPTAALSLVHVNVSDPPVFALKPMAGTVAPEQTVTSMTDATIGVGLIVIVKVLVLPPALVQPSFEAVTVIVPTILTPVLLAGAV